jgi:hypothetical protein
MKIGMARVFSVVLGLTANLAALGQNTTQVRVPVSRSAKRGRSPGGEIASGSCTLAKGAAKGVGHVAEGAGKGVADLATLHPIGAATALGSGGVSGGKDIAVGAAKGAGQIAKGIGRGLKHIF